MPKTIALVGHCGPDSSYLRLTVSRAAPGARVVLADEASELNALLESGVDLVLINRQIDWGFDASEGVELIRQLRASHPQVRTMLVSNFPDAQRDAVEAGALPGFGKKELRDPRVTDLIRAAVAG